MKEYIERAKAIERFTFEKGVHIPEKVIDGHDNVIAVRTIKRVLREIPAADVAEVRHGRWIFEPGKIPYCSECKEYSDDGDKGATFCPWCGARIDKEDDHEAI